MMKRTALALVGSAIAATLGFAAPASAALTVVGACSASDLSVTVASCSGWFGGNLLNANKVQDQFDALKQIGFTWDKNWSAIDLTKVDPAGADKNTYDFAALLNGTSYLAIHKGKGGKNGFEGTGFFKVTSANLDLFTLNLQGGSSAVLYSTEAPYIPPPPPPPAAVPEPATWAMMITGFGLVGGALRRRQPKVAPAM